MILITARQSRMARAALGWGIKDLAIHANIGINTVTRFENGGNVTTLTMRKIGEACEKAGVEFTFGADGLAGVQYKRV